MKNKRKSGGKMEDLKTNKFEIKKILDDGKIKYLKKVDYDMNIFYTKLAENIYKQIGFDCAKCEICIEGKDKCIVIEDTIKDNEICFGKDITNNTELSLIKEDLKEFLLKKHINKKDINNLWNDFLKVILPDIYTLNSNRGNDDWSVLINKKSVELSPDFNYFYTFSQNTSAMKGLAEAIENKNITNRMIQKYNIQKYTKYLNQNLVNIGLQIGEGKTFAVNMETNINKYDIVETAMYIRKELGEKEYKSIERKIDLKKAMPKIKNDDYEIYCLLAKLHICSVKNRLLSIENLENKTNKREELKKKYEFFNKHE